MTFLRFIEKRNERPRALKKLVLPFRKVAGSLGSFSEHKYHAHEARFVASLFGSSPFSGRAGVHAFFHEVVPSFQGPEDHMTEYPNNRILRRPDVEIRTGLSRSTIYAMMAEGSFPKPIKIGKRAVGWPECVIGKWLESRTSDVA